MKNLRDQAIDLTVKKHMQLITANASFPYLLIVNYSTKFWLAEHG